MLSILKFLFCKKYWNLLFLGILGKTRGFVKISTNLEKIYSKSKLNSFSFEIWKLRYTTELQQRNSLPVLENSIGWFSLLGERLLYFLLPPVFPLKINVYFVYSLISLPRNENVVISPVFILFVSPFFSFFFFENTFNLWFIKLW